jgi:hypothetical protein
MNIDDADETICLLAEDFKVIHAALEMVVTGANYSTAEAVKLERRAWSIVARIADREGIVFER